MIPYSIEHVYSSEGILDNDVYTKFDYIEKNKLNDTVINVIVGFMYEFCNQNPENIIKITSYKDFCDHFWKKNEIIDRDWYYIFKASYYEKVWIDWNTEDYQEEIYLTYVNKYQK